MNTTLYPLTALFAWTVVLSSAKRFPAILKEPARLAAWCLYLSFALIFTAGWSEVWNRTDAWTGLPESNTLITMCLVVCYSASQLALLQLWSYGPDRAQRRIKVTISIVVVVLASMITLFVHSDSTHHLQQSFKDWYGGSVEYEAYLFIYLTTYTTAEVEVIRLCRRYAKVMSPSWLRTGLVTASIGAAIGLLYSITRLADVVAALADVDMPLWRCWLGDAHLPLVADADGAAAARLQAQDEALADYRASRAREVDILPLADLGLGLTSIPVAGLTECLRAAAYSGTEDKERSASRGALASIVRRQGRLVLLGRPGTGKTVASRLIVAQWAATAKAPVPVWLRLDALAPLLPAAGPYRIDLAELVRVAVGPDQQFPGRCTHREDRVWGSAAGAGCPRRSDSAP